ncbi:COX15/CtaA family protein [Rhodocytophaga aerolata]|uniref:COX15/CtaA family protein n=1 Tax=Rhodocytophaga aerolata TaxID=455078 RepID=A0ABT8R635_9BACT|nr:COX15/CtaA family protein [Rhodocytophaga aerolata]MDO1447547.1 COX15/CtaA family protein [Rhodocytophaga aerolata]
MSDTHRNSHNAFRKMGIVTIVAVYLLILVGGIVRSTGAGMGCPDWPQCFGSWVPPTDVAQLPANYQEIYKDRGYADVEFNVYKTWTEYINRLIGVLIGIFIFLTLLLSVPYLKTDKTVFFLSLVSFILVGFQGWLGSVVVATNLAPWMVTVHMLVAIVLVFLLIYTVARSFTGKITLATIEGKSRINKILYFLLASSVLQIVLGTQVREAIDEIAASLSGNGRDTWIEQLGLGFYIHRSLSSLILAAHLYLLYLLKRNTIKNPVITKYTVALVSIVLLEILAGMGMAYLGIPAFLQPIHLLLAVAAIGIQFVLLLFINYDVVFVKSAAKTFNQAYSYK